MNATLARLSRVLADVSREPDGRLLDAFLGGSQPAFRELVERHGRLVFAVCNRVLRHRQDAEDAFQAVFLVLARRAADVWPRDAVGSWLYGVAHRVALKARAVRARRHGRECPLEDAVGPVPPVTEPDTAEAIERAVRKLPEVYRAAVVACDLEGLSRKDAAGQLGWTEGTLSGRLARARKLLAERLRKLGLALPAGGLAAAMGTDAPVRAGLTDAVVDVVSGFAAVGVPAPLVALTQGVVPGMFAFKLKAAAAAVVLACGLGYGAWAAGNGGQGAGAPDQPLPLNKAQPASPPPPAGKVPPALQPLQGKWRVVGMAADGKEVAVIDKGYPDFEISGNTLSIPYRDESTGWRVEKTAIAVDPDQRPPTIDLIAAGKPVGKGIYELSGTGQMCASCHQSPFEDAMRRDRLTLCVPALKGGTARDTNFLRIAVGTRGPRPEGFGRGADGVVEFWLERVTGNTGNNPGTLTALTRDYEDPRRAVNVGRADLQRAQAALELAKAQVEQAALRLHAQEDRLKVVFEAYQEAKLARDNATELPEKAGDTFTLHIRTLEAPEKVVWTQLTAGSVTVLDAIGQDRDVPLIRGPEGLSVWVLRGKTVMPVDLGGIVNRGETKTNYVLKAGDKLFVQVKLGK